MNRMTYAALTAILITVLTGCSLTAYSGTADVAINLGDLSSRAPNPDLLQWTSLTVSAPDIESVAYTAEEINRIITLNDGVLVVPVPAGASRTFTLSADTGTVIYTGVAVEDIATGTSTEVFINMLLADVAYIVPNTNDSTIVQLDNMNGDNPVTTPNLETISTSYGPPIDIDIDSNGTVYSLSSNTSWILQAPAITENGADWSVFQTAALADYTSLTVRRSDNTVFVINEYEISTIHAFSAQGVEGDSFDLSSLFFPMGAGGVNVSMTNIWDIAVLDTGEIGVAGDFDGEASGYAVIRLEYDPSAEPQNQWNQIDYVASYNNGTFAENVASIASWPYPKLAAYGTSFYLCGTVSNIQIPGSDYIQIHELYINPQNSTLVYNTQRVLEFSEINYQLFHILPNVTGSIRMGVTDPNNDNMGVLIEFESFDSENTPLIYNSTPFNFYQG